MENYFTQKIYNRIDSFILMAAGYYLCKNGFIYFVLIIVIGFVLSSILEVRNNKIK